MQNVKENNVDTISFKITYYGSLFYDESSKLDTLSFLEEAYRKYGIYMSQCFFGFFAIVVDDYENGNTILIRSEYGSSTDLYFSRGKEGFIIADSLNGILDKIEVLEKCDLETENIFLRYGFLPGTSTLIKNVLKVPPGSCIVLDNRKMKYKEYPIYSKQGKVYSEIEAVNSYIHTVDDTVMQCIGSNRVAATLSGGFDSNLLLNRINQVSDVRTDVYCVGGKTGRDETEKAELISQIYERVRFHKHYVGTETLLKLPEIVRRLEGSVCERGIFLQYELAKMLHENNETRLIAGDGADQIMNCNFAFSNTFDMSDSVGMWKSRPDIVLRYIVLQKSQKMLESFGVEGVYPYMFPDVVSCCNALKGLNGVKKSFHMKVVVNLLGESIAEQLQNVGGTTFITSLFSDLDQLADNQYGWDMSALDTVDMNNPSRDDIVKLEKFVKRLYLKSFYEEFLNRRK